MTQNNNQNLIKFYSISQKSFNHISQTLTPHTSYIIQTIQKHKLKTHQILENYFQLSMTLLYSQNLPLDLIKIISIFTLYQHNNLPFNQSQFISYCQQLNIQPNF